MRLLRSLTAYAILAGTLLAFVSLAAYVAGQSSDAPNALALSATPHPLEATWEVDISSEPVAGHAVHISAAAMVGTAFGASLSEPSYHLSLEDGNPPLELVSAAEVSPASIADGAEWDLVALRDGEATFTITLDYVLSHCITGTPCGSYGVIDSTTQVVAVTAILGDCSCDGSVGVRDAALVLQLDAGLLDALPCAAGDTNGDGVTDTLDALVILQHAAGLTTVLAS